MRGWLAVLAGCYSPKIHPGSPCTSNDQCPQELSCVRGTCGGSNTLPIDGPGLPPMDSPRPPDGGAAACANFDLGSSLGVVANDTTVGHADSYMACGGGFSPDVSYAWTAPATAKFTIDLCSGPDPSFDSVLYVRDGSCTGTQLACDDDGCGGASLLSKVQLNLTAAQLIVIIVDGLGDAGKYTLTITQN
jgi:hypothetical protein